MFIICRCHLRQPHNHALGDELRSGQWRTLSEARCILLNCSVFHKFQQPVVLPKSPVATCNSTQKRQHVCISQNRATSSTTREASFHLTSKEIDDGGCCRLSEHGCGRYCRSRRHPGSSLMMRLSQAACWHEDVVAIGFVHCASNAARVDDAVAHRRNPGLPRSAQGLLSISRQ